MNATRLVTLDDAPALAELQCANREFLAPWDPVRNDGWFTVDGQRTVTRTALAEYDQGRCLPHVILDEAGQVAGRITLSGIVRGAFQSCSVGFWLDEAHGGRGLASAAVRHVTQVAFGELRLHRVQAETLPHNVRSQRVLERTGFTRFGVAPAYLKIAGRWQDHIMWQVLNPAAT